MKLAVVLLLALISTTAFADDWLLAPGKSVTIIDASDPSVRLVITAPEGAPLDLQRVLTLGPGESVHSIATRIHMNAAGGLTKAGDGSIALGGATVPGGTPNLALSGAVLVRTGGSWQLHSATASAAPSVATSPSRMGTVTKPGVTREQAERDIRQCKAFAEQSSASFLRNADKVAMYNQSLAACLKSFGYELHPPSV